MMTHVAYFRGRVSCLRLMIWMGLVAGMPGDAYAYVDPISGSVVFQVMAAAVLGGLLTVRLWSASLRGAARGLWTRIRRR